MKMNRLAIVSTHPIQYHAPIFKELTAKGINFKVFYTWGDTVLKNKYDPDFGKTIQWDIPLLEEYDYEFCKNISKEPGSKRYKGINNPNLILSILQYKATHLLVFGWCFKSHLQVLRYFKGEIPVIFRGDSTLLNQSASLSIKSIIRKVFLTWVYKHIDIALYVGTANKAYYKNTGLKETQLVFAPHAIDNNRFGIINLEQEHWITSIKENASISEDAITIVFCGKLQVQKNAILLVKAINKIHQKNVHLFIIGNGVLEADIKEEAANNSNIHFLPFQNQSIMPAVYRLGDIFCLPSQSETWGLTVNEAMASSKAILVSNKVGCAINLVKDGINGYIFENDNIDDLTSKLSLMVADKGKLEIMGIESYKMIQPWSFEEIAETVYKVMETLT